MSAYVDVDSKMMLVCLVCVNSYLRAHALSTRVCDVVSVTTLCRVLCMHAVSSAVSLLLVCLYQLLRLRGHAANDDNFARSMPLG